MNEIGNCLSSQNEEGKTNQRTKGISFLRQIRRCDTVPRGTTMVNTIFIFSWASETSYIYLVVSAQSVCFLGANIVLFFIEDVEVVDATLLER